MRSWKLEDILGIQQQQIRTYSFSTKGMAASKVYWEARKKSYVLTCDKECCQLSSTLVTSVPELRSSQEEADTRLLLHAYHALRSGFCNVIIQSDDTDVAVIILSTFSELTKQG